MSSSSTNTCRHPQRRPEAPIATVLLLFIVQTLLLASAASASGHHQYRDGWTTRTYGDDSERCDRMEAKAAKLEKDVESLDVEGNLDGLWVSEECEVRPGPQFLVRSYRFTKANNNNNNNNDTFFDLELRQYHYSDRQCRVPIYAITVSGSATIRAASRMVPGATRVAARVDRVEVTPHTQIAAEVLQRRAVASSCPWESRRMWLAGNEYVVYNSSDSLNNNDHDEIFDVSGSNSVDCLDGLKMTFGELRLARMEVRPIGNQHHGHHQRTELLLGDVHTDGDGKRGRRYRPTAMQPYSLLKASQIIGCKNCERISRSTPQSPPRLLRRPLLSMAPEGEWISRRCETRPNSFFLRRRLDFRRDRNWSGNYSYFADARCTKPIFVAYAQGRYMPNGPSLLVDGGSDYDFKITRVHITPLTAHLATNLRATPAGTCGADRSLWRAGASVDITPTGGCAALGLKLPLLERELIKVEREAKGGKLLLYLGQIATDANSDSKHKTEPKRPTSYQPALLQCRQREPRRQPVAMELLPEIMAQPLTSMRSSSSVVKVPTYLSLLLCIITTIIPVIRCQSMFGSCR